MLQNAERFIWREKERYVPLQVEEKGGKEENGGREEERVQEQEIGHARARETISGCVV